MFQSTKPAWFVVDAVAGQMLFGHEAEQAAIAHDSDRVVESPFVKRRQTESIRAVVEMKDLPFEYRRLGVRLVPRLDRRDVFDADQAHLAVARLVNQRLGVVNVDLAVDQPQVDEMDSHRAYRPVCGFHGR